MMENAGPVASSRRERLIAFGVFLALVLLVFFPTLFMDRVVSPFDVLMQYQPWKTTGERALQNPLDRHIALVEWSEVAAARENVVWNSTVAGGRAARAYDAGFFSPFICIPMLLLPFWGVPAASVFLKIVVSFWGGFFWLRNAGASSRGATIGAVLLTCAGSYAVLWLWPAGNATSLAGFVFLSAATLDLSRRRSGLVLASIVLVALFASGDPAAAAILLAGACVLRLLVSRFDRTALVATSSLLVLAVPLSIAAAALSSKEEAARTVFPFEHVRAFVNPYLLGTPVTWAGNALLGDANGFNQTTIYVGIVALLLALLSAVRARVRFVAMSFVFLAFVFLLTFTRTGMLVATLVSPHELRLLLPLLIAALATFGMDALVAKLSRWGRFGEIAYGIAVLALIGEVGFFAVRWLPYARSEDADLARGKMISWLQQNNDNARIGGFFDYLPPNSSATVGIEDVRGRDVDASDPYVDLVREFQHEIHARRFELDPRTIDLSSPMLSFLNVRYLLEHREIDILRWRVNDATKSRGSGEGKIVLSAPGGLTQQILVDEAQAYALELYVKPKRPDSRVTLTLRQPETGRVLQRRSLDKDEMERNGKIYLPLRDRVQHGNVVELSIEVHSGRVEVLRDGTFDRVRYGFVTLPIIIREELSDGRIFENLAARRRYFASWRVDDGDVRVPGISAAFAGSLRDVSANLRRAKFEVYGDGRIVVTSGVPSMFVTSEKIAPGLEVRVDGKLVTPLRANRMFVALPLASGRHTIELKRRWPRETRRMIAGAAAAFGLFAGCALVYARRIRATRIT